jgi:fibronectin type 3 domain-containing protein/uncharacterized membrane protein YgdD (TMEM256/DUF423 family)
MRSPSTDRHDDLRPARTGAPGRRAGRLARAAAALAVVTATATTALGFGAALVPATAGATAPFNWVQHHPLTTPVARKFASLAYDQKAGDVVLFGGTSEDAGLSTTWTWNGSNWTEQSPATAPSPRTGAAFTYTTDGAGGDLLFGGLAAGKVTATTWLWSGGTWTQPVVATHPQARAYASMAYDPAVHGPVLFGGYTPGADLATVWVFSSGAWHTITPATPTAGPSARTTASMAYDTATGQLVLFGGSRGVAEDTTWVFKGTTWTLEAPLTAPSARSGAAMAYDPTLGGIVLFGGSTTSGPTSTTWLWTGTTWAQLHPATSPPGRAGASAAFDAAAKQVVIVNGVTKSSSWTGQAPSSLTAPGAPTGARATRSTGKATVSWVAPASDGGTAITRYTVTATPGTATCTTTGALTCTVTGLTNGTRYSFTVTATNAVGTGGASGPSNPVTPAGLPRAPTDVTATAGTLGSHLATVGWAAATGNGTAVNRYTVTSAPGTFTCTTTGALSCPVTGLSDDVAYTFTVTATSDLGSSPASSPSAQVLLAGAPTRPTGVSAARGNRAATVSWTAATTDGSAVTGYKATSTPGTHTCTAGGTTSSCTVSGLTNGVAYTFRVTATNGAGAGPASTTSTPVIPATVPFAPTGARAVRGDHKALVSWTAATGDGTAVTGYKVTSSPGTLTCTTTGALSCSVVGLTNGVGYAFTVKATNGVGTGAASKASTKVIPATLPGAPVNLTVSGGDHQATVAWNPATDNGTTISGYTVTSAPGTKTCATTGSLRCTVDSLTNGVAYTFTVTATNGVGTGPASKSSAGVTPAGLPGAPTAAKAVRGTTRTVTVSWAAATTDGAAITDYSVVSSPAAGACRTVALTCTVSGLVNGTSYTFSVKATNSVGTGAASAPSNAVVPAGPPPAPGTVVASAGPTSITLTWAAATDNGQPLTGYEVLRGTASGSVAMAPLAGLAPTATSFTDTTAVPGTIYAYEVEASNDIGTGTASTPVRAEVDPPGDIGARMAALPDGQGYWEVRPTGGTSAFGRAQLHGSLPQLGISVDDIVGMTSTVDGKGYWQVSASGGIFAFGDAAFYGSLPTLGVSATNIVGISATPDGRGYWIYGSDGGIFAFGDAAFYGSTGGMHLNRPIVGMSPTPTGHGYWLVASDGGIFSFGKAAFHGSTGAIHINQPIVAMTATPTGGGYWLVASDGGIFCFTAPFYGSTGGTPPPAPVVGIVANPAGTGYSVVDATGTAFPFPAP